jgi:hypothetical protein
MLSHWSTFVLGVYPQTHTAVCSVLKAPVQYLRNLYMGAIQYTPSTQPFLWYYCIGLECQCPGGLIPALICAQLYLYVCATCDLKLCVNYVEPEIEAAGARLF